MIMVWYTFARVWRYPKCTYGFLAAFLTVICMFLATNLVLLVMERHIVLLLVFVSFGFFI